MNGGWTQLIFVLAVVGFSFLRWLFQQIAAQTEKRRQQQAIERDQLEALRTGRAPSVQAQSDTQSAEQEAFETEARRREELAELRRRAAARRGALKSGPQVRVPGGQAPSPLEILLGLPPGATTGGTVSPRPRPTSRTQVPPTGRKADGVMTDPEKQARRWEQQKRRAEAEAAAAEARRRQEGQERRARERVQREAMVSGDSAMSQARAIDERLLKTAKPVAQVPRTGGTMAGIGTVPRHAAEWRRAIIMNEILNRPLSLR